MAPSRPPVWRPITAAMLPDRQRAIVLAALARLYRGCPASADLARALALAWARHNALLN